MASASNTRSPAARDAGGPGLAPVLDRLRGVLERLAGGEQASPLGPAPIGPGVGPGAPGMGVVGEGATGPALAGLGAVQATARQVQQALAGAASAFDASLGQAQQAWRRNVGGFAGDFVRALKGQTRRRKGRGVVAGRATRRASTWARSARGWADQLAGLGRAGPAGRTRRRASRRGRRAPSAPAPARWAGRVAAALGRWRGGTSGSGPGPGPGPGRRRRRRRSASWAASARRRVGSWATSVGRRWGRARRSASRWAKSSGRRWRSARRATARWARARWRPVRAAGRSWGRRVATARRRANRTYARTGSIGRAFHSGGKALAGRGVLGMLGSLGAGGAAFAFVRELSNAVRQAVEAQNARNAHLGRYSGEVGQAFQRLAIGDMTRDMRMAREVGSSAATLANITNRSRDIQSSFDRLGMGLGNRVASAAGVVWNALAEPWARGSDMLTGAMNRFDPGGDLLSRIAGSPFSASAYVGGLLGTFLGGNFSMKDALDAANQAFDAQQKAQQGGQAPALDAWANWMQQAPAFDAMRPMTPIKRL